MPLQRRLGGGGGQEEEEEASRGLEEEQEAGEIAGVKNVWVLDSMRDVALRTMKRLKKTSREDESRRQAAEKRGGDNYAGSEIAVSLPSSAFQVAELGQLKHEVDLSVGLSVDFLIVNEASAEAEEATLWHGRFLGQDTPKAPRLNVKVRDGKMPSWYGCWIDGVATTETEIVVHAPLGTGAT
ncbi:hypothetical protein G7046_g8447 [Stylonectria norvegica]|nr:hypothetical protein G7046_g8447 [Stylonectria norvegica]